MHSSTAPGSCATSSPGRERAAPGGRAGRGGPRRRPPLPARPVPVLPGGPGPDARVPARRGSPRPARPPGQVRKARRRAGPAGRARHRVPRLLDVEAGRLGGGDVALRGGCVRARRPPLGLAPRVRPAARPHRRRCGRASDRPGSGSDPHPAPVDPHGGSHLRLPRRAPRRRPLPRRRVRARPSPARQPCRSVRTARRAAAALRAGHRVELLGGHRRPGQAPGGTHRHRPAHCAGGPGPRPAGHGRHRIPRTAGAP